MRRSFTSLSSVLLLFLQSCSPSVQSQCEMIISAHDWIYTEMRKNSPIKTIELEDSDSFYAEQIEQKRQHLKEASKYAKDLKLKHSNQTLKTSASSASKDLKFMIAYYEDSISVLEYYDKLVKSSTQNSVDIQETRDSAVRKEDYLAHIDTHSLQRRKLNEIKDYCAQK